MQSIICSEHLPENCFRLIETPNANFNTKYRPKDTQGEILADANYDLINNKTGKIIELEGKYLIEELKRLVPNLFIPSVLARCTIIPL